MRSSAPTPSCSFQEEEDKQELAQRLDEWLETDAPATRVGCMRWLKQRSLRKQIAREREVRADALEISHIEDEDDRAAALADHATALHLGLGMRSKLYKALRRAPRDEIKLTEPLPLPAIVATWAFAVLFLAFAGYYVTTFGFYHGSKVANAWLFSFLFGACRGESGTSTPIEQHIQRFLHTPHATADPFSPQAYLRAPSLRVLSSSSCSLP